MNNATELKFKFNDVNILKAKKILEKYPKKFSKSAVLPLLHLAQDQLNGWLNIYKPVGISSFSTIYKIKKKFNIKKIGHAGTLDPNAEGILPIAINNYN